MPRAELRRERLMLHADRRPQCTNSQLPPRHQSETVAEHRHLRTPGGAALSRGHNRPFQPEATTQVLRREKGNAREEEGREGGGERGFRDCRQDRPEWQPESAARCLARLPHGADLTSKTLPHSDCGDLRRACSGPWCSCIRARRAAREEHAQGRGGELEGTRALRPIPARRRRVGRTPVPPAQAPAGSRKSTKPPPRAAAQPPRAAAALARTEHRLSRAWELAAEHELAQGEERG